MSKYEVDTTTLRRDFASLCCYTDIEREINWTIIPILQQKIKDLTLQLRGTMNILNTPLMTQKFRRTMENRMLSINSAAERVAVSNNLMDSQYLTTTLQDEIDQPSLF